MFGSEVLDVAIGLVLVFLLLSLFATAVREGLESVFKTRAVFLEAGIRELLDDRLGNGLARDFYEHPLIFALYRGDYTPGPESQRAIQAQAHGATNDEKKPRERVTGGDLPTYIPSALFSTALVDLMVRGPATGKGDDASTRTITIDTLRAGIELIPSARVRRALVIALDDAKGDLEVARHNIEGWFDASMQRVSGWYKRRTHYWLLLIGALSTLALNVNTIAIAQHLARSKAARELIVSYADSIRTDSATAAAAQGKSVAPATPTEAKVTLDSRLRALQSLDLPIGWEHAPAEANRDGYWYLQEIVGLLLTTLAVSLGAPFWFDALNKVMTVKTTGGGGQKKEK